MRKLSTGLVAKQIGFTLIELVIVIVIIAILAAVAIPKLTDVSDSANKSANMAILGAVKSAWTNAYAVYKTTPTAAQIAAQVTAPSCSAPSTTSISCASNWLYGTKAAGQLLITYDATSSVPANTLACNTSADCS
jgi:prepilin-type N-terminal cleavage/methylation domain-containing protein